MTDLVQAKGKHCIRHSSSKVIDYCSSLHSSILYVSASCKRFSFTLWEILEIPEILKMCLTRNCSTLHSTTFQHFTALNCTALYCTALHCTALHCTALHCTALHCPALYDALLYCITLHCSALHCTELKCSALHCSLLQCTVGAECRHDPADCTSHPTDRRRVVHTGTCTPYCTQ